jgi:hypothetical protein
MTCDAVHSRLVIDRGPVETIRVTLFLRSTLHKKMVVHLYRIRLATIPYRTVINCYLRYSNTQSFKTYKKWGHEDYIYLCLQCIYSDSWTWWQRSVLAGLPWTMRVTGQLLKYIRSITSPLDGQSRNLESSISDRLSPGLEFFVRSAVCCCDTPVIHLWYICDIHVIHMWYTCDTPVIHMWCTCDTYVTHLWYTCDTPVINVKCNHIVPLQSDRQVPFRLSVSQLVRNCKLNCLGVSCQTKNLLTLS